MQKVTASYIAEIFSLIKLTNDWFVVAYMQIFFFSFFFLKQMWSIRLETICINDLFYSAMQARSDVGLYERIHSLPSILA